MLLGGWSIFRTDITEEEKGIFEAVTKNLEGVKYDPIAIATQVVNGTNYKFFCNAQIVYPNAPNQAAMITIYQPLKGPTHITSVKMLNE